MLTLQDSGVTFNDGTAQTTANLPKGVGETGQTWQNMLSPVVQRATGISYTNTTGRPIQVSFWGGASSLYGTDATLSVDGQLVAHSYGNFYQVSAWVTCIIPIGSTYIPTFYADGPLLSCGFFELR